jgi:hypothetical protein
LVLSLPLPPSRKVSNNLIADSSPLSPIKASLLEELESLVIFDGKNSVVEALKQKLLTVVNKQREEQKKIDEMKF